MAASFDVELNAIATKMANAYYGEDCWDSLSEEEFDRWLCVAKAVEPVAWQWRYVGEERWRTPSGGGKLTDKEINDERRHIEQRPLYAIPKPNLTS